MSRPAASWRQLWAASRAPPGCAWPPWAQVSWRSPPARALAVNFVWLDCGKTGKALVLAAASQFANLHHGNAGATNLTTAAAYGHLGAFPMLMMYVVMLPSIDRLHASHVLACCLLLPGGQVHAEDCHILLSCVSHSTGQKPVLKSKQGAFQIIETTSVFRPLCKYTKQVTFSAVLVLTLVSHVKAGHGFDMAWGQIANACNVLQLVHGGLVPSYVREAMRRANEERPGTCHIELPEDVARELVCLTGPPHQQACARADNMHKCHPPADAPQEMPTSARATRLRATEFACRVLQVDESECTVYGVSRVRRPVAEAKAIGKTIELLRV
jgi:hypothetical protein